MALQALEGEGAIEHSHHHPAWPGLQAAIHQQQIAIGVGIIGGDIAGNGARVFKTRIGIGVGDHRIVDRGDGDVER